MFVRNRVALKAYANETIQWLQNEFIKALSNSSTVFEAFSMIRDRPDILTLFGTQALDGIFNTDYLNCLGRLLNNRWDVMNYKPAAAFKIMDYLTIENGTLKFLEEVFDDYCSVMDYHVGRFNCTRANFFAVKSECEKAYVVDDDNRVSVDPQYFGQSKISIHRLIACKTEMKKFNKTAIDHFLKPGFEKLIYRVIQPVRKDAWSRSRYIPETSHARERIKDSQIKFHRAIGKIMSDRMLINGILEVINNQTDYHRNSIDVFDSERYWQAAVDIARQGGNHMSNYSNLEEYSQKIHGPYLHTQFEPIEVNEMAAILFLFLVAALCSVPAYRTLKRCGVFGYQRLGRAEPRDFEVVSDEDESRVIERGEGSPARQRRMVPT
jgi:hypothetical protein